MIEAVGDDALALRLNEPQDAIQARAEALRASGTFAEVVPTLGLLTVVFDPLVLPRGEAARLLRDAARRPARLAGVRAEPMTIPVRYDGEDLPRVAEAAGLSERAVIEAHASARYAVLFLGFTPGFAYLGGLPDELAGTERLASPRVRAPAGSVGVAGGRTGVYALAGPGGWPIIGRTEARLFDPSSDRLFSLTPDRAVRFEPVR